MTSLWYPAVGPGSARGTVRGDSTLLAPISPVRIRLSVRCSSLSRSGCGSEPLVSTDFVTVAQPVVDGTAGNDLQWPTALRIKVARRPWCPRSPSRLPRIAWKEMIFQKSSVGEDDSAPERRILVEDCKALPRLRVGRSDVCVLHADERDPRRAGDARIIMGAKRNS